MRKIWVIAAREYKASVRTKAFVISLIAMPILMGGSLLVQLVLKDVKDTVKKRFTIVDRTGKLYKDIDAANRNPQSAQIGTTGDRKKLPSDDNAGAGTSASEPRFILEFKVKPEGDINELRYQLSEKVRRGELFGFAEIGPRVIDPPKKAGASGKGGQGGTPPESAPANDADRVRYQTNSPTHEEFPRWLTGVVNKIVQEKRRATEEVDREKLDKIIQPVELVSKELSQKGKDGTITEAPEQNRMAAFGVPFGLMMLMFMVVMVGATPLMQGIVEEKMQRIAEVLLGSVRPFDLMLGKLVGMVGVSLTLMAVYLGGGYWAAHHFGYAGLLPPSLLIWFLVYQVLSVLMFGSLFIAIGAACTDIKETQTLVMPVMILACFPMFFLGHVIREPNSSFALGVSFFPFATPMLMVSRLAVPPQNIPVWQPLLGAAVVLVTTALCVYAAGRIFRVGILMQGKGAKISDLVRWVFKG
jgi:ABC-2 type transport system permease protein